jgi:peptide/nickel transport system substrate-binding protein
MTGFFRRLRSIVLVGALALGGFAAAMETRAESVLRVAVPALSDARGNPFFGANPAFIVNISALFESLTLVDNRDGALKPWLAVRWEQTSPTSWRFFLREGVKFSNGAPLTARAVTAAIDFLQSAEGQRFRIAGELANIEAARAIDDSTVEFVLKSPDPLFPRLLHILLIPEPDQLARLGIDGFAREPIGTGPWMLENWSGQRGTYRRNPHAWIQAPAERMELVGIAEKTSRVQAVASGAMDVAGSIEPADVAILESAGGRSELALLAGVYAVLFRMNVEGDQPWKDRRVREALNYAVNKEQIVQVLMGGTTAPSGQPVPRRSLGYDPAIEPYPYDPAKAKALLAEAGYASGFTFTAEGVTGLAMADIAAFQQIAVDLNAVGVTMRVQPITYQQLLRNGMTGEWKGDAIMTSYTSEPTLDGLRAFRTHSCTNPATVICDREVQPLIEQAFATTDLAERERLTQQIVRRYHEEAYSIFLYDTSTMFGVGPRVEKFGALGSRLMWNEIELKP